MLIPKGVNILFDDFAGERINQLPWPVKFLNLVMLMPFKINTRTHLNVRREEELAAAPPVWTGQTGYTERSDRSPPPRTVTNLRTLAWEDPSGQAHVGLF